MTNPLDIATDLAAGFEGESLPPYLDPAGIPTIGFGSIWDYRLVPATRVTMETPAITDAMARAWLRKELVNAVACVAAHVKAPLTVNMIAALADFVFNLGSGAFAGSTLLKDINAGNFPAAEKQFLLWDHSGGVELAGLFRRRQAEAALFASETNAVVSA